MKIYVNEKNEIKDVNFTSDTTLTEIEVTDHTFDGWSSAKVLCYKVNVVDGNVVAMTPYVDSRLVEHLDKLGQQVPIKLSKRAYIGDTQVTFPYADGIISASVSGNRPCGVTITDYEIIVNFDELQEVATVTISII